MPLPTFTPPVRPSPGHTDTPTLNILSAEFADSYTQAAPAGLNHLRHAIAFNWNGLTPAQAELITDFLEERGGTKSFFYQPLGFGGARKWLCKAWSVSQGAPVSISAAFTESFSNET